VLLVGDHAIMREGLQSLLEQSGEFAVVGQARDGAEAVRTALDLSPDVILMDVMMPKMDGVEACREIMATLPTTRVIMLTASTEEDAMIEALAAGATGYLQKVSGMDRLLSTVQVAAAGEMHMPTEIVRRAFARLRNGRQPSEVALLTTREREIVAAFAQGMSYTAIAEARGVRPVTIRNAIYGIQRKLGVGSKQEIVVWAVRNGLLDNAAPEGAG